MLARPMERLVAGMAPAGVHPQQETRSEALKILDRLRAECERRADSRLPASGRKD